MRDIRVGDKVRIIKEQENTGGDSRTLLKLYVIVRVFSIEDLETKGELTVLPYSKKVNVSVDDVELVRDTDLGLGEIIGSIYNGTLKEGSVVTVNDETFKVYKDVDGLGLKQESLSGKDWEKDVLCIPSRYIKRSYILPPLNGKVVVSKEDLELKYNAKIEFVD